VDGKIAGVMRREPPYVLGDGKHTVRELVEKENKNPLRHGPIFHEIALGDEAVAELKKQNLTLDSIAPKNKMIFLHEKVSRSYGASTTEITDIHPDNRELFLKIAATLGDPLVGVDFMITDMARSWHDQLCGVIECNSLPFIDLHHFPLKGPAVNVAGMVWDMALPASRHP
jgi:cyanophycin synthetase